MSGTLERVKVLVSRGEAVFSLHGQEEMEADGIAAREVVAGLEAAIVIEDYPDYWKGPAVLVLQRDRMERAIHGSGALNAERMGRQRW